jgi:putative peptidoglycan lipid II flippase
LSLSLPGLDRNGPSGSAGCAAGAGTHSQASSSYADAAGPEGDGRVGPSARAATSGGRGIARAAAIVSLGAIASRALGLLRDNRNAYFFGASGAMSAFAAASLVPKNIYELLVGGMVSAALVPVFSEYASNQDSEELWSVLSVVLSFVIVITAGLLVATEAAAPLLSRILVGGFGSQLQNLTTSLIRSISPAILFFGISGILTAALYAQQAFVYPSVGAAVFNLGGLLGTQLLARHIGISSLTLGIVLGAFLQMAIQVPGLRGARIRFSLNWRHPALGRIIKLYLPVFLSLVISQVGIVIDRNLASHVGEQTIAWMESATRIRQFPLGLVSTAVSMAVLPALSRLDLRTDHNEFRSTLALGLRLVLVLIVPAAIGLFVLGKPIITLIYEHGQFSAFDTQQASTALYGYLLGTPFAAVDLILIFAFYSQKDTVTPVVVGIVCVLIYLIVAPTLAYGMGLGMIGLVLANSIQLASHALAMLALLIRRMGRLEGERLLGSTARIVVASLVMGCTAYLCHLGLGVALPGPGVLVAAARVIGAGLAGLLTYALTVTLLGVGEATLLRDMLWQRARGVRSPQKGTVQDPSKETGHGSRPSHPAT